VNVSADTAREPSDLQRIVQRVQADIEDAEKRAGRRPGEVSLLAVTKRKTAETVRAAIDAGLRMFGENYVQEAVLKKADVEDAEWHLIGHLQTNKARIAVQTFSLIQTLDSEKLAQSLSRVASEAGVRQRVLVQVHLGDETTKTGTSPGSALALAELAASLPGLELEGFMGVAPLGVDPRPHFRSLRLLFEDLPAANRKTLSMGMSSDYQIAIEEGSAMVRIGSSLFGERQ